MLFKKGDTPYNKLNIPKESLIKLYIDEERTLEEVGKIFNTSAAVISKRMTAYKIKARSLSESHMGHIPSNKKDISKDILIDLYINKKLPMVKIAEILKCCNTIICDRMKLYGIEARDLSEAHKGQHSSPATQFKKGLTPWNKDTKGLMPIPWSKDKKGIHLSPATEFKKGTPIELHPRWLGGISIEPYSPDFNQQIRDRIRVRDNFICQLCGVPELECDRRLAVHHIDYNKKNGEESNLISLCASCHCKTNANRKYWTNYFQERRKIHV